MHARVLAGLVPVALLVAACSPGTTTPTTAPSSPSTAVASSRPTLAPTVEPTVAPSAQPAATPASGDIAVVLSDAMRYAPDAITVRAAEEVSFIVRNDGAIVHEFFVGDGDEQAQHAEEMAIGGMSHGHDNALSLKPGESGMLTMTFPEPGSLLIGCHEAGHYEAGMQGTLTVVN